MPAPANFSVVSLRQVLQEQLSVEENAAVFLAFSGGLDSHVLLHALSELASDFPFKLTAVHIDHSLQLQSADWANHCQAVSDGLSVPLIIKTLNVEAKKGESLEAAAREVRYAALAECLPEGGLCLTAQHRNDQSETLLLQLFRGAGVHGLASMPVSKAFSRGRMLRPLLAFSREDLLEYASSHKLVWVEDPSNQDNRFDRNFLRNEVLPVLRERWPGMDKSLSRSARHAASAAEMLDGTAKTDLLYCKASSNGFFPPAISCLEVNLLAGLSSTRRINAVRYWVRINGLPVPGDERMQSLNQLLEEFSMLGGVNWPGGALKLDNNNLWLFRNSVEANVTNERLDWLLSSPLQFQGFELRANTATGEGLSKSMLNGSAIQVGFRQGGEQCRMPGDHGKKPLKTLFQDISIPSWMRDRVPLMFLNNELVAVSSLWSNPHFLPGADEDGYVFSVQQIDT